MNQKRKNNYSKESNGITLIALVVTIIVLIILAGISINLVLGENGIITKAKEAKTVTEQAQLNEEVAINGLMDQWDTIVGDVPTVKELKEQKIYTTKKTTAKDSNGNIIKIPEGFKIAEDSGINVTEGIVIEDRDIIEGVGNGRGNQYVWIPVSNLNGDGSNKIKKQNEDGTISEIEIVLGRYVFADGENHKDEEEKPLTKGTPILKQTAENYEDETGINVKEINPTSTLDYEHKELKTNRAGVESSGTDGLNATALNLKAFIDSVKANGGYYIARYEASYGTDGKANSKVSIGIPATSNGASYAPTTEGYLWNNITQINAATASRGLYEKVNTDLINSYGWDTAIVYIQEFSGDTDYSRQNSKNTSSNPANTGVNGDEVCKINDMASNTNEWTTEYSTYTNNSSTDPCTYRGGVFTTNNRYTSYRNKFTATPSNKNGTFRFTLYM